MEALYGRFNGGLFDNRGKTAKAIFTPTTANLALRAWAKESREQDDSDDANDLCECQDLEHPKWVITTAQQASDTATSKVLFTNEGRTITFKFWLKRTPMGWRVDDFEDINDGFPPDGKPKVLMSFKASQEGELKAPPG